MLGFKKYIAEFVFSLPDSWLNYVTSKLGNESEGNLDIRSALACQIAKVLPNLEEMAPEKARKHYQDQMRVFDEAPIPLPKIEDKLIPTPRSSFIPIRVYYPKLQKKNLPILLFFHGGGLTIGNLETHDALCRRMAHHTDCIVIAVDYRLAPEFPFPAAHDDVFLTYQYVRESAFVFGGNKDTIGVVGDSAGALLATSLLFRAKKEKVPLPIYQALLYPMLDMSQERETYQRYGDGYVLTTPILRWFIQNYTPKPGDRLLLANSPALAEPKDCKGFPHTYLGIAGFDPLRAEGESYAQTLQLAGVKVEERVFPSLLHGYLQMTGLIPAAKEAEADLFRAIRRFFSDRKNS